LAPILVHCTAVLAGGLSDPHDKDPNVAAAVAAARKTRERPARFAMMRLDQSTDRVDSQFARRKREGFAAIVF